MKTTVLALLIAAGFLGAAGAAHAQASAGDVAYCKALAQKYTTYVGGSEFGPRGRGNASDPEARLALEQCESNPQAAIPLLESRLRDNKIDLPSR